MKVKYLIAFIIMAVFSCKTLRDNKAVAVASSGPSSPMSCTIEGEIVGVANSPSADPGTICAQYPCRAYVKVIRIISRGSAFSVTLNGNDTIQIIFAYTLHSTADIFPSMKVQYPGLKIGDKFIAEAIQHMQTGTQGALTIYGYQVMNE